MELKAGSHAAVRGDGERVAKQAGLQKVFGPARDGFLGRGNEEKRRKEKEEMGRLG